MTERTFFIEECTSDSCGLRLPVVADASRGGRCPRCGGPMRNAFSGRLRGEEPIDWQSSLPCPVHGLIDNVRSAFNVGSIFRIAAGVGITKLNACGITPTPDNAKVAKTALGAEHTVSWSYHANAVHAADAMISERVRLWALENLRGSSPLESQSLPHSTDGVCLIVGNEITGIDPDLIDMCERVIHIPMQGDKGSLNVAVAFGIAVYWLRSTSARSREYDGCCA